MFRFKCRGKVLPAVFLACPYLLLMFTNAFVGVSRLHRETSDPSNVVEKTGKVW